MTDDYRRITLVMILALFVLLVCFQMQVIEDVQNVQLENKMALLNVSIALLVNLAQVQPI